MVCMCTYVCTCMYIPYNVLHVNTYIYSVQTHCKCIHTYIGILHSMYVRACMFILYDNQYGYTQNGSFVWVTEGKVHEVLPTKDQ